MHLDTVVGKEIIECIKISAPFASWSMSCPLEGMLSHLD
jgi:hypothetical protein